MWGLRVIVIFLLADPIVGVIYKLPDKEYSLMPPIRHLDEYEGCLEETNGLYCTVHFDAVSDVPNELLTMMQEYSKHHRIHFNHTSFLYGICMTRKCNSHVENRTTVQKDSLEGCLNDTFTKQYKLETHVTKYYCERSDSEKVPIDASEILLGLIIIYVIIFNCIASLYDVCLSQNVQGMNYLKCFSIQRNWRMLIAPSSESVNHVYRLNGLNGFKTLIIISAILCHTLFLYIVTAENIKDIEKTYQVTWLHILISGSIIIQVCFLISGFLLMYQIRRYCENNVINFSFFPKGILMRLLRILPVYAVVLGITSTWFRRFGSGPFWETLVMRAANDCRQNWWIHLLFLNNFVYNSECLIHSWYIAADTQLYILGLFLCSLLRSEGIRRKVFLFLFILGVLIPPIITYFLDLDGRFILAPEENRINFRNDPTYNEVYVRSYTNLAPSALGLMMGDYFYQWQRDKTFPARLKKFQKYSFLPWLLTALCVGVMLAGRIFYNDAPREPLYVRVLFAAIAPPIFIMLFAVLIFSILLKFENTYSRVLEWDGWRIPTRLSYAAFLVHLPVLRVIAGARTSLSFMSPLNLTVLFISLIIISFSLAIPLWIMVEAPFQQIANLYRTPKRKMELNGKGKNYKAKERYVEKHMQD